ncbi:MAG: 3-deoxy-manno-octulosonate cytidylyltransferase, partial [Candidatus Eisenbacteria bacterium]
PARIGATRFPAKPLALLRGEPMIVHVWRRAASCPALAHTVVATDDEAIAAVVQAAGGEAVLTRADHASGTDRVAEVCARPEFRDFGAVVNVQGDEPAIDPRAIAAATAPVLAGEARIATLAYEETDPAAFASPDAVKVVLDRAGDALYFTRAPIEGARANSAFLRHIGLYAYERDTLLAFAALAPGPLERAERLEQLRALWHGIKIRVVRTPHASRGVDTPADLAALERDWDQLTGGESPAKEPLR